MQQLINEIRSRAESGESAYDIFASLEVSRTELIAAIGELSGAPPSLSEQAVMLKGQSGPICAVVSAEGRSARIKLKGDPGWAVYVGDEHGGMPSLTIMGPEKAKLKLGDNKVYPSFSDHKPMGTDRNLNLWTRSDKPHEQPQDEDTKPGE
jgi:hypothetical protein